MKKEFKMLKSPLGGWLGGKFQLRKKIIERFPDDYLTYCEAFCGAAWVFFALQKRKGVTFVLNDKNKELINFFDVVKIAQRELVGELQYTISSRALFERYLVELRDSELTSIQRAARFYYLLKCSFGGQLKSFGYARKGESRLNLHEFDRCIDIWHNHLQGVHIEKKDFREIIRMYDWEKALFYLDPPYRVPSSKSYVSMLTDSDYVEMRDMLCDIRGYFVLSINNDEFIRELFRDFQIIELPVTYSVQKSSSKKVSELLIMNY